MKKGYIIIKGIVVLAATLAVLQACHAEATPKADPSVHIKTPEVLPLHSNYLKLMDAQFTPIVFVTYTNTGC